MDAIWTAMNVDALASLPLGWALTALFVWALAAATLLPLGSEVAVLALAHSKSSGNDVVLMLIWLVATLGNTCGGMVTYAMGRAAHRARDDWRAKGAAVTTEVDHAAPQWRTSSAHMADRWIQRHGAWVLVLSWMPVVGDALCAAAGWLRLPARACALFMAVGKGARYAAVLWLLA